MKKENTNLPLWKVLNEQPLHLSIGLCSSDEDSVQLINDDRQHIAQVEFSPTLETAQRIALAVNNLHHLAEALEAVIRVADRKTDEFNKAKEALKRIS